MKSAERFAERGWGKAGIGAQVPENTWLGWQDSNLRMPVPKTGALPLGYTPAGEERPIARHARVKRPGER